MFYGPGDGFSAAAYLAYIFVPLFCQAMWGGNSWAFGVALVTAVLIGIGIGIRMARPKEDT